ncbi:DUF3806 domain-containing protein [Myroides sp. BIT-d1]|uniref:DUF3806 domain-containing protein n=1 Tax=Myroides albus TaxID=2562892 RepID=A0A6I3LM99_9FLAO|nr:DUF3806 domain-containing protein [Myroides albus]MTG97115.1 DUF3806 domain-containing protein [Myroides albus]
MKIFEIGNGQTIMKGSSDYYCSLENEKTLQIYKGLSENEPVIRVSMLYFQRNEGVTQEEAIRTFQEQAKEHNAECTVLPNKVYYAYDSHAIEDVYMHVYEVMYGENIIIVSLSAAKGTEGSEDVKAHLEDMRQMVESIDSLASLELPLLEPTYNDMYYLSQAVVKLYGMDAEEIDEYYTSGKAIDRLQTILDNKEYDQADGAAHFALGMAFGVAMVYEYPDLHWVLVSDQYGRELALQYQNLAVQCFPISMILKRLEDNEVIDVKHLLQETFNQIQATLQKDEDFRYLEYNY